METNSANNAVDDGQPGKEVGGDGVSPSMPFAEFIILTALLISLVALSIDAILPSLQMLGAEMGQTEPQQLQLVITVLFAGLAIGQLFYGPISDQLGRKRVIFFGLGLFLIGNGIAWYSTDFETLLLGRFLQGLGAAAPRIVLVALIRDLYHGRMMARVMSFVLSVFIFVPVVAPILGQFVAQAAGWRAIFLMFILLSLISGIWFHVRQKETLLPEKRIRQTPQTIWAGLKAVWSTPSCVGYMLAAGFAGGPLILYLSIAPDLFQNSYQVGTLFPYYFAGLALSIGIAAFINGRLVTRFGMRFLVHAALVSLLVLSVTVLLIAAQMHFLPPIWLFLLLFFPQFFCLGILFGNMNALAMEEVGHVAGMASAMVGSISTLVSMLIATLIGQFYDGTMLALGGAFLVMALCNLAIVHLTEMLREKRPTAAGV